MIKRGRTICACTMLGVDRSHWCWTYLLKAPCRLESEFMGSLLQSGMQFELLGSLVLNTSGSTLFAYSRIPIKTKPKNSKKYISITTKRLCVYNLQAFGLFMIAFEIPKRTAMSQTRISHQKRTRLVHSIISICTLRRSWLFTQTMVKGTTC